MTKDAYEYLIGQFAANAGKGGRILYATTSFKILAKIVTLNKTDLKNVYDPTCGSGHCCFGSGMKQMSVIIMGRALNSTTYNLARMNMLLHEYPSRTLISIGGHTGNATFWGYAL